MRHIFGTTHIGFSTQRRILSPPNVFKSNWEISSSRILQPVREAHNHRLWKPTNITRQYSRTWIYQRASAVALFTSLLAFHVVYGKPPRLLEAGQDDDEEAAAEDIFNESSNYRPILKPLSMEMAEEILRWNESSEPLQEGSSVLRLDQVRVASNNEVEDYLNVAKGSDPDGELRWIMTGVYDGHAGWNTGRTLQQHLIHYTVRALGHRLIEDTYALDQIASREVDQAIRSAFLDLDKEIMETAAKALAEPRYLTEAIGALGPAYSGSCALLSFYNSDSKTLKIACTGDSRAVLGRRSAAGKWQAVPLSVDQTGYNPEEVARLQREHPNESEMIKNGRLLGLAVTRAFGDSRWKWPRELQEQARARYFGPRLLDNLHSPPYLTAEPVITTTKINPDRQDFVILASDGLWDNLSSEEAVDLVGMWLEKNDAAKEIPPPDLSKAPPEPFLDLPAMRVNPAGNRNFTSLHTSKDKKFILKDNNAATHLARNAMGGADEDRFCGLMTALAPFSRNMRDDISVQVIFFGNDPSVIQISE